MATANFTTKPPMLDDFVQGTAFMSNGSLATTGRNLGPLKRKSCQKWSSRESEKQALDVVGMIAILL
jgi:hypothetical protein